MENEPTFDEVRQFAEQQRGEKITESYWDDGFFYGSWKQSLIKHRKEQTPPKQEQE